MRSCRWTDNWVTVPTNSTITIHKQTVMIHPIEDEYYCHTPSHQRSSGYAVSKGLVSNAPGTTQENAVPTVDTVNILSEKLGKMMEGKRGADITR